MMGDSSMQCISSPAEKGRMAQRKGDLLKMLRDNDVKTIVIYGEAGVGKTWMAREISNLAKKKGIFHVVIWLFPNHNKYENDTLLNSIRRQLSLPRTSALSNVDDDDYEDTELNNDSRVKEKIMAELAKKKFLLVFDDVQNNVIEGNDAILKQGPLKDLIDEVKSLLGFEETKFKVLITMTCSNKPESLKVPNPEYFKVKPMIKEDAIKLLLLLIRKAGIEISDDKATRNVEKTRFLPPAIILMVKILSLFPHLDSDSEEDLLDHFPTEPSDVVSYFLTELLRNRYNNSLPVSVLIDCCWKDNHFFRDRQSVHYNELIAHWMLEGYLGQIDIMEKTYERGHNILMELMDCQILKKVDSDHVSMVKVPINLGEIVQRGAKISLGNYRLGGYCGTANLGLASVFQVGDWGGFGRIVQKDGTMTSVGKSKKRQQKGSVLLIDGNCFDRAAGGDLFQSVGDLEVLGLINPTYTSWSSSTLTEMPNLRILVMRGCDFLNEISFSPKFGSLTVLEISGAISLRNLADDFFTHMPKVRSINFSGLQIEKLPSTLYGLDKLSWLILRNCSELKQLESLKKLTDLMVLDLCGASSLEKLADKNFTQNTKIQTLNLSGTKIKTIPLLNSLKYLTHLLLKGCLGLGRLRKISSLTNLQIIDLSLSTNFIEFHEGIQALKVLDLSETSVKGLPSKISNLQYVNFKGCPTLNNIFSLDNIEGVEILDLSETTFVNLECKKQCNVRQLLLSSCVHLQELPDLNMLTKLEVLDLSGCTALTKIPENSFLSISNLRKLDLSKTKIEQLPSISHLTNLLHLSLDGCIALAMLSGDNTSVEQKFDLSTNEELNTGNVVATFLENMNNIQYLNLSETNLKLPSSMLNITDLRQLYLRGCNDIVEVPNLEKFTKLEILDLSGSGIRQLPSLKSLSKLRQLLLADCFNLLEFHQVRRDHLLGMSIADLPYDIATLTQLELLVLPSKNNTERASSSQAEVLNQCDWIISVLPLEIKGGYELPAISGLRFAQVLSETGPSLWEEMHLSAIPLTERYGSNVLPFNKDHYAFRDIYFKTRHFDDDSSKAKSLEIRGFKCLPQEMKQVLKFAEFVFLIDNTFEPQFSDVQNIKGCWIERCKNIGQVFDLKSQSKLEVLGLSNTSDLNLICNLQVLPKFIENLTHLYLEYCPNLSSVFPTCQPPVKLKLLQIKFCDALENILGEQSEETEFHNLETLHLWELPKLERIGGKLPSVKTRIIGMCPKLLESEASDQ